MKVIVSMLTGIMLLLVGIFLLLIGADGAAVFFAIVGVIAFVLGALEGIYGGIQKPTPGDQLRENCPEDLPQMRRKARY